MFRTRAGGLEPGPHHWNNSCRVGLGFWEGVGVSPEPPGHRCGHSTLQVWDTDHPSIAKHHPPVHITLKDPSTIITQQQYSLIPEAHKGFKPIIDCLLQDSILIPTHSPHNTPIGAVRKGPASWRLVQDPQNINEANTPTRPVAPNPYTLLSTIPLTATLFTVLDLKDAFFTIPFHLSPNPFLSSPGKTPRLTFPNN